MNIFHSIFSLSAALLSLAYRRAASPPFPRCMGRSDGKRKRPFSMSKLHAARFRVCVGLAAHIGVLLGIGGKPLLQVGIVGTDMDPTGLSHQTRCLWVFFFAWEALFRIKLSLSAPLLRNRGHFFGCFSPALDLEKNGRFFDDKKTAPGRGMYRRGGCYRKNFPIFSGS